jgi:predicted phage baseplate assembly protein
MPLPDIKLDDRTFEELIAEAKRRIPGYTPEWTDLNDSDPGITLVQLFAWLSEMIIWRLNRVPEKNFVKFLELIGIEPNAPSPAHAELTFKLAIKNRTQLIPQGTRVALTEQVDGKPVIFETDDNLYAVGAELAAVQSFDGARFEIVTEAHRVPGKYFFPFGPRPQRDSALYLGFDTKFPDGSPVTLTLHAFTADLIEEGKGIKAYLTNTTTGPEGNGNEDIATVQIDANTPSPSAEAVLEYFAGKDANPSWQPLTNVRDETANFTRTGTVTFDPPVNPVAEKLGLLRKDEDVALFWIRYRIKELLGPGFERAPRLEDVLINTITATNAITVTDELLGASKGTPGQKFKLANTPVLLDRFDLQVDEGEGFQSWKRVRDFAASTREDRHFILATTTGEVAFGDGEQGKIPGRLVVREDPETDQPNIKVANYRWGGGAGGNAGANKITSLESSVPFVDSVTNLRPAIGGQDEETIDEAKLRAPETIRTRSRAVTSIDFEFLARQTPGARIRRAHALPLRHPDFEPIRPEFTEKHPGSTCPKCASSGATGRQECSCSGGSGGITGKTSFSGTSTKRRPTSTLLPVPGVVTVVVVPEALSEDFKPLPSEDTLKLVGQWLNQHRLITTELYVAAPKYREVEIEARVIAQPTANSGQVAEALQKMLLDYFHPLRGGTNGNGWDFGGTVYFAETYRRILNTPGVARLEADAVITYVDGQPQSPCADVFVNDDELVFSRTHKIIVTYA